MLSGRSSSHKLLLQSAWRCAQTRGRHKLAVVLKEDVPDLGVEGDQVVVKPGYVRNYLYPQKMAVYAPWSNKPTTKRISAEVKKESEGMQAASPGEPDSSSPVKKGSAVRNQLKHVMKKLTRAPVVMHVAMGAENQLQRPLYEDDVRRHVARTMGIKIPPDFLNIPEPLMKSGTHNVGMRVTLDRRESPKLVLNLMPALPKKQQKAAKK